MKKIKLAVFVLIALAGTISAQQPTSRGGDTLSPRDSAPLGSTGTLESNSRSCYTYLSIGVIEPLALGVGFQVNPEWAMGVKWGVYWLSGRSYITPPPGVGVGTRISQRIGTTAINNINYELAAFYVAGNQYSGSKALIRGGSLDINIGHESYERGMNFIWSLGVTATTAEGSPLLVLPNLKIGFNVNL